MFVLGLGYAATRLAVRLSAEGWQVHGTGHAGDMAFDDDAAVRAGLREATHILSSVPPGEADPVLARHADAIIASPARWIGYLSSTGVYGDAGGAWVDEGSAIGGGRRTERAAADLGWQALDPRVRVFRLPGIYGPGRSVLDRVAAGTATRIDEPGQMFSRIHVDDIAGGVIASFAGPPGIYNLADDAPAPLARVVETACDLLGRPWPPLVPLDQAGLSPAARAFHAENRRVANGKAKRLLGWRPLYPDWRAGLRALIATTSPIIASTPPATDSTDQR